MPIELVTVPADGSVSEAMMESAFAAAVSARSRASRDHRLGPDAVLVVTFMAAYSAIVRAARDADWDALRGSLAIVSEPDDGADGVAGHA